MSRAYSGLRMRPLFAAGMAFALCVSLAVRSSAADVGEWIPSDALVVFKINKLQQVNDEAGALMREFGIADQEPDLANPLATFQQETGIREGLNLEGNLAVYLASGDLEGENPPLVILIPVSDYQAFLGNFKNQQDEGGGITRVRMGEQEEMEEGDMGDEGDAGYVMQMGEYAGLSPVKELLKKPEQAIEFAGVTAQMLDERDAIIYANFRQLGPMLVAHMQADDARAQAKEELMQGLGENERLAKFQPVAEAFIDQFFDAAQRFFEETDAGALSLNLTEQGISFGSAAQFKPGSYLANLFSQMNTTDGLPLAGLPEGNYIVFGGTADNRAMNQKLFEDFAGPIIAQLREVEGAEKIAEYADAVMAQVSAAGEARFGMLAPSGPAGNSPLVQQIAIQGGDVQQLKEAQRKMVELQPQIMAELMGPEAQEMGMGVSMEYQEDAKTVAGVSFDKLSTQMEGEQMQQGPAAMLLPMIFGPEGPTSYLGEVEGKLVVVGGLKDSQIAQLVEAVQAGSAPLADDAGVQAVAENLLQRRSGVVFFRPDELVRSAVGMGRQMGMNLPIQMPENLPPAGFAVGPDENAIRTEAFVPKDLISALIVAGLQFRQAFEEMQDQDF